MGMDIYATNPRDPDNAYFRANVWRWRGIHSFMSMACQDVYGKELDTKMSYNDGNGIPSNLVETCAAKMQELYDKEFKDLESYNPFIDDPTCPPDLVPAYSLPTQRLQEWINFVKDSGGFEVW